MNDITFLVLLLPCNFINHVLHFAHFVLVSLLWRWGKLLWRHTAISNRCFICRCLRWDKWCFSIFLYFLKNRVRHLVVLLHNVNLVSIEVWFERVWISFGILQCLLKHAGVHLLASDIWIVLIETETLVCSCVLSRFNILIRLLF